MTDNSEAPGGWGLGGWSWGDGGHFGLTEMLCLGLGSKYVEGGWGGLEIHKGPRGLRSTRGADGLESPEGPRGLMSPRSFRGPMGLEGPRWTEGF